MENATRKKIKVLHSDNGEEYIDKDFTDFRAKEGIKREWTTPYNPQQNGVAERKNRTIVGAAKAMLYDQDLPIFLWAEACNTTMYIQNRAPHRALGKKTLGVFTRKKPKVNHLRIFGNISYCHMPDDKRTKLDQTAEKGVFVEYNETSKAFRIYIPSSRKIVVGRDMKFIEDPTFRRSREMPVGGKNQSIEAPLVQQRGWLVGQAGEQSQGTSTVTSTSISSCAGNPGSSQQMG